MANVNFADKLNRLLSDRLRECVKFNYEFHDHRAILTIGMGSYMGNVGLDEGSQRRSACEYAYNDLVHMTESGIRMRLGMPDRPRIQQADNIRDQLRLLKRKAAKLDCLEKRHAQRHIGRAYMAIDKLEEALINVGIE